VRTFRAPSRRRVVALDSTARSDHSTTPRRPSMTREAVGGCSALVTRSRRQPQHNFLRVHLRSLEFPRQGCRWAGKATSIGCPCRSTCSSIPETRDVRLRQQRQDDYQRRCWWGPLAKGFGLK
jgi:hypothetical protein